MQPLKPSEFVTYYLLVSRVVRILAPVDTVHIKVGLALDSFLHEQKQNNTDSKKFYLAQMKKYITIHFSFTN